MSISVADELVESISELRELFPDWRIGQLVANLVTAAGGTDAAAIWDVEDEQLLAAARRLIDAIVTDGPNQGLQKTTAAILIPESALSLSAAYELRGMPMHAYRRRR